MIETNWGYCTECGKPFTYKPEINSNLPQPTCNCWSNKGYTAYSTAKPSEEITYWIDNSLNFPKEYDQEVNKRIAEKVFSEIENNIQLDSYKTQLEIDEDEWDKIQKETGYHPDDFMM